jgi:hypothetical protein
MMEIVNGKFFRGFLASSDISTAAAIPLFDGDGNAITLKAGERPIIYEALLSNGATASIITVFADTDGSGTLTAGEELFAASLAINANAAFPNANGYIMGRISNGAAVNKLMAVASAASVGSRITILGNIINN